MIHLLALWTLLSSHPPALAGSPVHSAATCGTVFYSSYDPPYLRSMGKLPAAVSTEVRQSIVRRIGPALYNRLRYFHGQVIDPVKVRRSESLPREPIPTYILIFTVQGHFQEHFWVCGTFDAVGRPIEEFSLPDIVAHPERASVIERDVALSVARRNGVPMERAQVRLEYFRDIDALEWQVSYDFEVKANQGGKRRVCHIPAHDPTAVHWSEYEFAY